MRAFRFLLVFAFVFTFSACAIKTRSDIAKDQERSAAERSIQENLQSHGEEIADLQSQLGVLQGKAEETDHKKKQDLNDIKKSIEGLDAKISVLEESFARVEKGQEVLYEELSAFKKGEAVNERAGKLQKKSDFDQGQEALKHKNFEEAEEFLSEYVEKNAKSKNYVKANFLLGDALFQQKKYNEAIIAYSVVHEKALKTGMGRESTLKIVESFAKLGRKNDAKTFAQLLIDKFPGSKEAKRAKKYL